MTGAGASLRDEPGTAFFGGVRGGVCPHALTSPAARRKCENGFTLVELMIVVTVIGLASAIAVLAIPDPRGRLVDEGARFATRVRAAQDAAVIAGRPISVWVTPGGYGFDERRSGQWISIAEKPLRVARWGEGTQALIAERARVTFDSTGMADRSLVVPLRRERTRVTVTIGAAGGARVDG
jgi:general secretion pathway protein H